MLASGARAAQAGEFTQRAFLNGRIDLSEAEAVMSLISAKGEQAAKAALSALDGALSREIRSCADELVSVSAGLAAWVDYPDEEIEELSRDEMQSVFVRVDKRLSKMLNDFDMGQAATQGVDTVIAGRPNVGKSTLMNLLSGSDKSIVTSVAGTTRDIVEQDVVLGSVTLRLADTAGLRQTDDAVESIGVERAKKRVERAQLVLAVFDGSQELTDDDKELLALCRGTKTVGIINKNDLLQKSDRTFIEKNTDRTVEISALDRDAAQTLGDAVSKLLGTNDFDSSAALLANERQRDSCRRALEMIREAQTASKSGVTLDAVNVLVDTCIETLLEITGEKASETVVNEIFSRFCVGK